MLTQRDQPATLYPHLFAVGQIGRVKAAVGINWPAALQRLVGAGGRAARRHFPTVATALRNHPFVAPIAATGGVLAVSDGLGALYRGADRLPGVLASGQIPAAINSGATAVQEGVTDAMTSASNTIADATPADAMARWWHGPPRPSSTPPDVAAFRANRLVEPDVLSNMTAEGVASLAASSGFTSGVPGSVLPHAMMQRAAPEIADEVANTTVNNPYWRSPPQPSGTASTIGRWANNAGEWLGNNWHWAVPTAGGLGALGYYLSNRRRKNDDDEEKNAWVKQAINVQHYAPIAPRRQLSQSERSRVEEGQSRWFPEIWQSYDTEIPDMMSSPGRGALLHGVPAGLLGAALGGAAGSHVDPGGAAIGAGLGGVGVGGLMALIAYMRRQQANRDLEETMRRLPPGANKRDYLSDPVVQARGDGYGSPSEGIGSGWSPLLAATQNANLAMRGRAVEAADRTCTLSDALVEMSQTAPLAAGFLIKCAELRLTAADAIAACKRAAGVDPHIRDEFVKAGLYGKVAARSGQPF